MFAEARLRVRARQLELRLQSAEMREAMAQDLNQLDLVWWAGDVAQGGWRRYRALGPWTRASLWTGISLLLSRVLKRRRRSSGARTLWWVAAKTAWRFWRHWQRR